MQLDSVYVDPGFLLLAVGDDGQRLGCVGARPLPKTPTGSRCEVRRLFVRDQGRGLGVGRALADQLVIQAQLAGFTKLVLNTLPEMTEAVGLYESMGFRECEPYVDEPLDGVLYFSFDLAP